LSTSSSLTSVYDGDSIWLIPYDAIHFVKISKRGEMTLISVPSTAASLGSAMFHGGAFDGRFLWAIPLSTDKILKVDVVTNVIVAIATSETGIKFTGCIFDGQSLWLVPSNALNVWCLDVSTSKLTRVDWPVGYTAGSSQFLDALYDGTSIWMAPFSATLLIQITPAPPSIQSAPLALSVGAGKNFGESVEA